MGDVNNEEELEEFLRALPHRARVGFAARAALRVAPYTFRYRDHVDENFDGSVFLLACLRANLVSGVAGTWPTHDTREIVSAARSAASAARSALSAARSALSAAHPADSAALSARSARSALSAALSADSADSAALSARSALSAALSADSAARSAALSADSAARSALSAALSADSAALSADSAALSAAPDQSQQIFATPLWPAQVPEKVSEAVETFEEAAPGTPWAFWARWYRGMFDGKPLDWELQRQVALIDDAIWKAGPKAVAQEIARIERLFELEHEIAALKATLPPRMALSSTSLIGDNGGPPLNDGVQQAVRGDFVLIWDQIEALEAEITKPEPSLGKLKKIAKALLDISVRIASYCGGKIDLALTEASKEAGKAVVKLGAPIAVASLAAQNEGIQQVAKAIWAFVKTLPPG
ncbi:hypothetical protein KQ247_13590 [Ruegeria pomeroyi]|nr:hypothetical protein [Ruegeria pomeroyi]QWV07859.1 hypothetical protein KQ247_13590 [Ruegeria pomeroyi]